MILIYDISLDVFYIKLIYGGFVIDFRKKKGTSMSEDI